MVKMKTMIPLTDSEIEILKLTPHHFNKLGFTQSSTSTTTPLRVLRDSTSKLPIVGGVFSAISQTSSGLDIGDGLTSILNHRLCKYAASLDIRKACRQIKVTYRDSLLRLSIWYKYPVKMEGLIIYRMGTAEFGGAQASMALRVAQEKYITGNCKTKLGKFASECLRTIILSPANLRRTF